MDDYPIHQTAEPIIRTASSDRNTYDRYWYNGHDKEGSYYFGIALCRYPNLGIQDCSLSISTGGKQYAFHGSRRAPQEPTDLSVGPFSVDIIDPMGRHRVVIEDNDTGISCDLLFTPVTAPCEEGRQTSYNERHVVMDATRLDQFGYWQGTIRFDGKVLQIDPRQSLGLKDRSWGIRPVGTPYTGGAPLDPNRVIHFFWLPLNWGKRCTLAGAFEHSDGYQWHNDQVILPTYEHFEAHPAVIDADIRHWQGTIDHAISFRPGTRQAQSATISMSDRSGERLDISVEPLLVHYMKGLGYQNPEWGHGRWHGELEIGAEYWDLSTLDTLAFENLHIQQVVKATCGNETAYGVFEQFHMGPYEPYGFTHHADGFTPSHAS
ncbi:hypothetical protein [Parahaliea mediterranea]|uniref:Uncharacterized protein n=1 Tax=Parahaliea mediterranea TaxID=651086 RepID=A0A939DES2_9GAMM|nr:hypothetical protein [Parahaliea mediterranea]MBN7796940.1 hypothetical protein [Parahaliea mediterranea]